MTAAVPAGLVAPKAAEAHLREATEQGSLADPIKVSKIKVSATFDQRKRELGDGGEQWALADVVGTLLAMNDADRASAVEDVRRLLGYFEPAATKRLLEHASAAAAPRQMMTMTISSPHSKACCTRPHTATALALTSLAGHHRNRRPPTCDVPGGEEHQRRRIPPVEQRAEQGR